VELAGVPTKHHAAVCAAVFGPYAEALNRCGKEESFDSLDDAQIRKEYIGADLKTTKGRTPLAVIGSKKSAADPPPRLEYRVGYLAGVRHTRKAFAAPAPHDVRTLPTDEALWLLYQACFTAFKGYICAYTPKARELSRAGQIRTAAHPHRAALGGGVPPPRGASHLPPWLASDLAPHCRERTEAARSYQAELQRYVQLEDGGPTSWTAVHVDRGGLPCPASLCDKDQPVIRRHRSNGVIVAVSGDSGQGFVYMKCTKCEMPAGGCHEKVERLRNAGGRETQWVKLDETTMALLKQLATPGAPPVFLRCDQGVRVMPPRALRQALHVKLMCVRYCLPPCKHSAIVV
jgi:hypothetical protein